MERVINKPVQAIISFREDGEMLPLWIKYERDDLVMETLKVENVNSQKQPGLNHIIYECWVTLEDRRCLVELLYEIPQHIWTLYRVLT